MIEWIISNLSNRARIVCRVTAVGKQRLRFIVFAKYSAAKQWGDKGQASIRNLLRDTSCLLHRDATLAQTWFTGLVTLLENV